MTELVTHRPASDLPFAEQAEFARMVTSGGRAQSILPDTYRDNPANVLIAVGLGQSMGLSPAESLYRISVIKGKPSAGAELIAANVRRAGHKLRVKVTENPPSATAQIIRADDPDFPFEVTRDMNWAKAMGLANNDNYKKQASTMLQWRAITAVARLACPEALYGVTYTPDEIREQGDPADTAPRPQVTAADFTAAEPEITAADVNRALATKAHEMYSGEEESPAEEDEHKRIRGRMFALLTERGITDPAQQRAGMSQILGRPIESRAELTTEDMWQIVDSLTTQQQDGAQQA